MNYKYTLLSFLFLLQRTLPSSFYWFPKASGILLALLCAPIPLFTLLRQLFPAVTPPITSNHLALPIVRCLWAILTISSPYRGLGLDDCGLYLSGWHYNQPMYIWWYLWDIFSHVKMLILWREFQYFGVRITYGGTEYLVASVVQTDSVTFKYRVGIQAGSYLEYGGSGSVKFFYFTKILIKS